MKALRLRANRALQWAWKKLNRPIVPTPETDTERALKDILSRVSAPPDPEAIARRNYVERCHELVEARQMTGSGPWLVYESRAQLNKEGRFRESNPLVSQGATGDLELALQTVEWRREVNFSLMEFSRWGIQQIILISRLYYIKHPWIRRGVDLSAAYVFGQGVELSSPDPQASDVLKRFVEKNRATLGQIALTACEKRKSYDGNLFWVLFPDELDTGEVSVRLIDATEIQDIICDPNDATQEQYFRRTWTQRIFDPANGSIRTESAETWYPALNFSPTYKPPQINGIPVQWESPVYHRKVGGVASWIFGCPRVYPALDWCKEARKFLEAFASVWQALHQIAIIIQTKGGQQAIEGIKQQTQTTVGPQSSLWDTQPTAVPGSTFASGPGTTYEAFNMKDAGGDPGRVKEFRNMVACCLEIPPTWLSDLETSNMSTAMTLNRPTELGFLLKQEEWQEDLVVLARYALSVSLRAPSGKLKEARCAAKFNGVVEIREAPRVIKNNHWVYKFSEAVQPNVIEIAAQFPAIREGDVVNRVAAIVDAMTLRGQQISGIDERAGISLLQEELGVQNNAELLEAMYPPKTYEGTYQDRTDTPEVSDLPKLIEAVVHAMTLGNRQGQIVGIDEKEGVRMLLKLLQIKGQDKLIDEMFPKKDYDPNRAVQPETPPVEKLKPPAGGIPQINPATGQPQAAAPGIPTVQPDGKALAEALANFSRALKIFEASGTEGVQPNGHA